VVASRLHYYYYYYYYYYFYFVVWLARCGWCGYYYYYYATTTTTTTTGSTDHIKCCTVLEGVGADASLDYYCIAPRCQKVMEAVQAIEEKRYAKQHGGTGESTSSAVAAAAAAAAALVPGAGTRASSRSGSRVT
jgi:hypothetical protein